MKGNPYKVAVIVAISLQIACAGYWEADQLGVTGTPVPATNSMQETPPISTPWQEYVVIGNVNVRSCPSSSCPIVGSLYLTAGTSISAQCDQKSKWCHVKSGYVLAACLGIGEGKCLSK